jgi:hypothetical protein
VPALKVRSSKFKSQSHQKKKKKSIEDHQKKARDCYALKEFLWHAVKLSTSYKNVLIVKVLNGLTFLFWLS